jgi:cbb3-type cytochrome oxidase cytochrome c subunit
MKGLQPLFLGIFGIFAFSWLGMTVVPNLQIGSLDPQSDEDGTDIYPMPSSGMAVRGARVYAANGCIYCHSQQVRPDYGGSDLDRKWGNRRSAPRDYIFEPLVMLGKMRTGPDLSNVGHRPALQEEGAAPSPTPAVGASPSAGTPATASPAAGAVAPNASASPANSAAPTTAGSPALAANAAPAPSPAGQTASGAPATLPAAGTQPAANVPTSAPDLVGDVTGLTQTGEPKPYTAAWHHRHLYNPRLISPDSNMPSYRFLYVKRQISGVASPEAINFVDGHDEPEAGWEIVPSYDAKCLVAYLMSRDQSHALKEAKSPATIAPAAAAAASPTKGGQK